MLDTLKKSKPKNPPPKLPGRVAELISLLEGSGATVDSLTKATGWKVHTLRARISGLGKPPYNVLVVRERKDGVTLYRIA